MEAIDYNDLFARADALYGNRHLLPPAAPRASAVAAPRLQPGGGNAHAMAGQDHAVDGVPMAPVPRPKPAVGVTSAPPAPQGGGALERYHERQQATRLGQALGGLFGPNMMPFYAGMALGGTRQDQGRLAVQALMQGNELQQQQGQFDRNYGLQERELGALERYREQQLALERQKLAAALAPSQPNPSSALAKLRQDLLNGFITQDEFDQQSKQILAGKQGPAFTVSPDGTVTYSTTGLPSSVQGDIAGRAVNAERTLAQFDSILEDFKPQFLTYFGRGSAAVGGQLDRLGVSQNELVQFNAERARFIQSLEQQFNEYRRQITGAAASIKEMADLKKAFISGDLGPQEFLSRIRQLQETMALEIELHNRLVGQRIVPGTMTYNSAFQNLARQRTGTLTTGRNEDDPVLRVRRAGE